jgi:hypothetical protein
MDRHRFDSLASDLQFLLDQLDPNVREGYVAPVPRLGKHEAE